MQRTTSGTYPLSYAECPQSTRTSPLQAIRASHTRPRFVDFAVDHAQPHGFIFQACAKVAPTGIVHRFGHAGFGELWTGNIADYYPRSPVDYRCGGLVRPILTTVGNLGMDSFDALGFVGTLGLSKIVFVLPRQVFSGVRLLSITTPELMRQPQVNANLGIAQRDAAILNLTLEVDVPAATSILCEAPGFRCALHGTRGPETDTALEVLETVTAYLQEARFERYPTQRPFPRTPFQPTLMTCLALRDILPAYLGNGIAVQSKLSTGTSHRD